MTPKQRFWTSFSCVFIPGVILLAAIHVTKPKTVIPPTKEGFIKECLAAGGHIVYKQKVIVCYND